MPEWKFSCPCGRQHLISVNIDFRYRRPSSTAQRKQLIARLLGQGKTQAEIGRRLKMSASNVSQFIRRHNITGEPAVPPREIGEPCRQMELIATCAKKQPPPE